MAINKVIVNGEVKIDLTTGCFPFEVEDCSYFNNSGSYSGGISFYLPRIQEVTSFDFYEGWNNKLAKYYWPIELEKFNVYRIWYLNAREGKASREFVVEDEPAFHFAIENSSDSLERDIIESISVNGVRLSTVTIPEGVKHIQAYCLCAIDENTPVTVILPSTLTTIDCCVVYYSGQSNNVVIKATTPPTLTGSSTFAPGKIIVPTESVDIYKNETNWAYLADIIEGGAENYDC